jgi:hypothetical protein
VNLRRERFQIADFRLQIGIAGCRLQSQNSKINPKSEI